MSVITAAVPKKSSGIVHKYLGQIQLGRDISVAKLAVVTLQLGLIAFVIRELAIEESFGLVRLLPLLVIGFIAHAIAPRRLRPALFAALSFGAIWTVMGAAHGTVLILIGLGLIGLCHLPISFRLRLVLIFGAAIALVALRGPWTTTSWAGLVLPLLGSMFMFRLLIYLYDLRHEKEPVSLARRLGYFFLLPNVCFPLFPVVDYQSYQRSYYDDSAANIYQKGVLWMFRGVTHLLLYRLVYLYLVPMPDSVEGLGGVIVFVVSSYMLYLRVSGLFHLIIGILCLFGLNLPETHHLFFLASDFNDVWRRLNIYWKDFMVKMFYYPVLMRTRRWGMNTARIVATLVVFVATWLLHSYQWFWMRGTFPLTVVDGMYWGTLGVLVVFNTIYVARHLRDRATDQDSDWSLRHAAIHALKILGMFVFMSFLWSFWSSASVAEWVSVVSKAGGDSLSAYLILASVLFGLVAVGILVQWLISQGWVERVFPVHTWFERSAIQTFFGCLFLAIVVSPSVYTHMGHDVSSVVASIRDERLNARDEVLRERGYYEGLLEIEKYTSTLWTKEVRKPDDWVGTIGSPAVDRVGGLYDYVLIPSFDGVLKRSRFQTNRWGQRDRDYQKQKPEGTTRIALLGASYEMGAGVENQEVFEERVEDQLNSNGRNVEIINFAVGGYSAIHNAIVAEDRVPEFQPDVVMYAVHWTEPRRLLSHLQRLIANEGLIPDPHVARIIAKERIGPRTPRSEVSRRLGPHLFEIIGRNLAKMAAAITNAGATPVMVYIPAIDESKELSDRRYRKLSELATGAGFAQVLHIGDPYGDHDRESLRLAPWDYHPNEMGHRLIADQLYVALSENLSAFELKVDSTTDAQVVVSKLRSSRTTDISQVRAR